MGKALMIAVDDSESSAYAVKFTLENLASSDDAITLVHVRSEVDVEGFYGTPDWVAEMDHKFEERARGILSRMKEIVDGHKIPCMIVSKKGDAREKLLEAVNEFPPTMLILGSRGLGMVKRTFLGSVSDYAAQHAECPVLIVKLPHP
ncbi:hypothetical protein SELMODRAFT_229391 [Selaginella moellendorffii]|uniref:UspA domain-containing protein n=1 Tax=Selaginella moellendorffii TaxID=88036 RepID=D8SZK2_SELML|nr:hypothetical protein SELMODRAFT_229391 [Selaginella moellendorffii]